MPKKIPDDPSIPIGSNKLASDTMFKERSLYRESAYTHPYVKGRNLWYGSYGDGVAPGKILYGRVDQSGYPVYPAEENLKQLKVKGDTLFALNFVADAFHDLQRFWNSRVKRDTLYNPEDGPLKDINAYGAWMGVHERFHEVYKTNYDLFTNHKLFLSTPRDEKITDFNGFLDVFREYCELQLPDRPMTRSAYMVSKFATPEFSGLIINIVPKPEHGDDYAKYAGYIQDPNFQLYVDAARRFGFAIDVNAPWRLIADISSPPMKAYLNKYGITSLKEMFKAYYIPAYKFDIDVFSFYMRNMYNSYVTASPNIKVKTVSCKNPEKTSWKLLPRKQLSVEEFQRKFPPRWWIRLYAWLRARESQLNWDQGYFEKVVERAMFYEKNVNIERALRYINAECKDNRRRLHGYPTLGKQEVEGILTERKLRGPQRPRFKF